MFGDLYLVAPVMELGARQRSVYLPGAGVQWSHAFTNRSYSGGKTYQIDAPLDSTFPVFKREASMREVAE